MLLFLFMATSSTFTRLVKFRDDRMPRTFGASKGKRTGVSSLFCGRNGDDLR